ncbi:hypothetical protein JXO52_00335 [bacterium]|nr:hypothetical protein [bacterium]
MFTHGKRAGLALGAVLVLVTAGQLFGQRSGTDQATLLLDLKKARANYETAKQQYENDEKLFSKDALSKNDFERSRNTMLSTQVEYQKLILRVISEQSYIVIERAVKYQTRQKRRKVRVVLRSTASGNEEYLEFFRQNQDVFTTDMRPEKVYNIFVSLLNLDDKTIIGDPYEAHVPSIELGGTAEVNFTLLRDVESLQILLNYGDRSDTRNVYLQQDASANIIDIVSQQFSQETNLGARATYDLNLERFSSGDDVYKLEVVNLPRQVTYEFIDPSTNARLSQVIFPQGVTSKSLSLIVYLPDRTDDKVVIDRPIDFYSLVLPQKEAAALNELKSDNRISHEDLEKINAGKVKLELIPRGVGRIEVSAPTLYHEIKTGEQVTMTATVKNTGTRRLDNIKIEADVPPTWKAEVEPTLIPSLDVEAEQQVTLRFMPPQDVGVGAQEVKIKTEAMADNRAVQTEDKTVRIQISAKTPLLGSLILILMLIGLVVGIVVFGIKLSRR